MRRSTLAVMGLVLSSLPSQPPLQEAVSRSVLVEVMDVFGEYEFGSGVIVESGWVLTNRHVVEDAIPIWVDGKDARLVRMDDVLDLALLACETREQSPVRIRTQTVVQEEVFYVGNPARVRNFVGRGRILGYPDGWIHSSAFAWPGFSGAGLYDASGALVGIQTRWKRFRPGSSPEGMAIPAAEVRKFLDR